MLVSWSTEALTGLYRPVNSRRTAERWVKDRELESLNSFEQATFAVRHALKGVLVEGLDVRVLGDSVRLRGFVRSYEEKRIAGTSAQASVPGVWVANELRVAWRS